MAIELAFSKSDDASWGFRLTGGSDCDIPLTVIKVYEDSIAENAGLQVGDVIVRINEYPTAALAHLEAHDVLVSAGQKFIMAVRRDNIISDDEQHNEEVSNIMESSLVQNLDINHNHTTNPLDNDEVTDVQIAEAISGETEVLPDQHILGVNFNKIDLTDSNVLKVIEEAILDTTIDLQNKKWSTFLQKPNTPKVVPKKKEEEQAGPKAPPYRVIIKKQPKKSTENIEPPSDFQTTNVTSSDNSLEIDDNITAIEEENFDELEDVEEPEEAEEPEEEYDHDQEANEEDANEDETPEEEINASSEHIEEQNVLQEVPLELEEQLVKVQKQLQALAQLPSSIQVTLDAVTQQLAKIVQASHKKTDGETETEANNTTNENDEMDEDKEEEELDSNKSINENTEDSDIEDDIILEDTDNSNGSSEYGSNNENTIIDKMEDTSQSEEFIDNNNDEECEMIDEEKASKVERIEEFHQRRLQQRPTNPLAPLQRPIILPGGRKWAQPDDALPVTKKPQMSDEKICETLDVYSEIISGHTKGLTIGTHFGHGVMELNLFTGTRFSTGFKYTPSPVDKKKTLPISHVDGIVSCG